MRGRGRRGSEVAAGRGVGGGGQRWWGRHGASTTRSAPRGGGARKGERGFHGALPVSAGRGRGGGDGGAAAAGADGEVRRGGGFRSITQDGPVGPWLKTVRRREMRWKEEIRLYGAHTSRGLCGGGQATRGVLAVALTGEESPRS